MARLYLIRHGEPVSGWGEGDSDPGLSARGRAQAEAAANVLWAVGRLALITSPMRRCRETAEALAPESHARIEPRITEVAAPNIPDRRAWLMTTFPRAFDPEADPATWAASGAEIGDWRAGVIDALRDIAEDSAVFTHFIAINAALGAALGRDDTICFRPAHCSITVLDNEGGALRLVSQGAEL